MKYWEDRLIIGQSVHGCPLHQVSTSNPISSYPHVKNRRAYDSIQGLWVGQVILKKEMKVEGKLVDISGQQWIGKK